MALYGVVFLAKLPRPLKSAALAWLQTLLAEYFTRFSNLTEFRESTVSAGWSGCPKYNSGKDLA